MNLIIKLYIPIPHKPVRVVPTGCGGMLISVVPVMGR